MNRNAVFGLGTFEVSADRFAGLVVDDRVHDLRPLLGDDVTTGALLDHWDVSFPRLGAVAGALRPHAGVSLSEVRPLPPVFPSGQIFCAGANYRTHTVEMSLALLRANPEETRGNADLIEEATAVADRVEADEPFVFLGQSGALAGAHDDVVLWGPGVQHDWELEVAVVIGRAAHRIGPDEALDHVAGYTICNDISTRDVMFRPRFALSDFLMSKNRPTFFPMGPYLVPRQFVPDPRRLKLLLKVNGEVMQDGVVDDIVHGVEELISYLSHATGLSPGDVVLTGTPAGNAGAHGGRWLRPGDVMESTVTGLGGQRNVCVAEPTPRHQRGTAGR